MEEVTFEDKDGNKYVGSLLVPKNASTVVIIVPGFSSNKNKPKHVEFEKKFNEFGLGTLRVDLYGHGDLYCKNIVYGVTKDITLTKTVDSLKAAIEFVRSKGNFGVALFGSSFGGLVSFIVASTDSDIRALALKSPVCEPISFWKDRVGEEGLAKWKEEGILHYGDKGELFDLDYAFWKDLQKYDTFKLAKTITCPVLIVHGGSDTVVPIEQSQELAKIVNTKVRVVEGANHGYKEPEQHNEMKKLIVDFIVEKL